MLRAIVIQILIIAVSSNFSFALNKKKQKETAYAKRQEFIADSLLELKVYNHAKANFLEAAIIFENNKYWRDAVRNYRQTAWCYFSVKQIDSAQYFINKASNLFFKKINEINEKEKWEESDIYYVKARIFLDRRYFDSTFKYLDKGFNLVNELNSGAKSDSLKIATYFQTYGTTNYIKGNYNEALKYNLKALDVRLKILDNYHDRILASYYNISLIHYIKKDYENSIQYLNYIINNTPDSNISWKARSYSLLGTINKIKENYFTAIEFYNKSIKLYSELGNSMKLARTLNSRSHTYSIINDFSNALTDLENSIRIRENLLGPKHPLIANNLATLGSYYYNLKEYDLAIKQFKNAIEIVENDSLNKKPKNNLYNSITLSFIEKEEYKEALSYIQFAIQELIYNYKAQGDKDPDLFIGNSEFLNPKYEINQKSLLYDYLINKAIIHRLNFAVDSNELNLKKSLDSYTLAFRLLDNVRSDISEDESKYSLSEQEKLYFQGAIDICLQLDSIYPDEAYSEIAIRLMDKTKGTTVTENSYLSNALQNSIIDDDLLSKESELSKKLAYLKTEINKGADVRNVNTIMEQYYKVAAEYDTLTNHIKKKYPEYYKLAYSGKFDLDNIKELLSAGEMVIEYFIGPQFLYIATINNSNHKVYKIPIGENFKENVLKYYKSIRKLEFSSLISCNSELIKVLINPIHDDIKNKKELLIIPDDYLYYIPFEALFKDDVKEFKGFSKCDYLIKSHNIKYHYSLNLWSFNKSLNFNSQKNNFLGFAPVFEDVSNEDIGPINNSDTTTRTVNIDGRAFRELKYTKNEINTISNLFENYGNNSESFFYNRASEKNFKENVKEYKFIHIASHGFVDNENPNLSGLAFYNSTDGINETEPLEDGLLYFSEIKSLDIDAELIVLSACETGIGKLVQGEGLIGMPRGFLSSNVPNVIYSLWNVADKNTSELMIEFYKNVLTGKTYSESLREVKLNMLENNTTSYPKIWSSFVLIGN